MNSGGRESRKSRLDDQSSDNKGSKLRASSCSSGGKRAGWTSGGFKLNQLLCNIERSLLAQFQSSSEQQDDRQRQDGFSSKNTLIKRKSSAKKSQSKSNSPNRCGSHDYKKEAVELSNRTTINDDIGTSQQVQNSPSQDEKAHDKEIEFRLKGGKDQQISNKRKMTLNKHQQLIISSLNPSARLLNSNNNKLSIPPPHANDNARRSLTNCLSIAANESVADLSSPEIGSATQNLSKVDGVNAAQLRQPAPASRHLSLNVTTHSDDATATQMGAIVPSTANSNQSERHNASSLQLTEIFQKCQKENSDPQQQLTRSQTATINANSNNQQVVKDDEDSGFVNYQSSRSLKNFASNLAENLDSNQKESGALRKSINMMQMRSTNLTNLSSDQSPNQLQQQRYAYYPSYSQQPQMQQQWDHQQKSMLIYGQQQLASSNQQLSLIPYEPRNQMTVPTIQGGLNTHISNQLQTVNEHMMRQQKQQQQFHHQQQQQLYNQFYVPKQQSIAQSIDNGQQIYANAPPKPRRYQFYNNTQAAVPSHLQMTSGSLMPPTIPVSSLRDQAGDQFSQHQAIQMVGQPNWPHPSHQLPVVHQHPSYTHQTSFNYTPTLNTSRSSLDAQIHQNQANHLRLQVPMIASYPSHSPVQFNNNLLPAQWQQIQQQQNMLSNTQPLIQVERRSFEPTNLTRSKSVSHLIPEFKYHVEAAPRSFGSELSQGLLGVSRFPTVSSVSTTELNSLGIGSGQAARETGLVNLRPPAHPLKVASQQNLAIQQMQSYFSQHQKQQLVGGSNRQHLLQPSTLIRQQQQQQFQSHNNWPNRLALAPSQNGLERPHQHDKTDGSFSQASTQMISQQQQNSSSRQVGQRLYRTSATQTSASLARQSLDDKIKSLMLANDDCEPKGEKEHQADQEQRKQALFNTTDDSEHNANNLSRLTNQKQSVGSHLSRDLAASESGEKYDPRQRQLESEGPKLDANFANWNTTIDKQRETRQEPDPLTNRIYVANSNQASDIRMGNGLNRRFQVNIDQEAIKSSLSCADIDAKGQTDLWRQVDSNSHLIVDLTTPRVLAKTQTRLQPQEKISNQQQAPPLPATNQQPRGILSCGRSADASPSRDDDAVNLRRTAPYYYSDLKSEEQRKALMEIVQQKSLSPPPQLLSRSTDQNSTRLGPKNLNGSRESPRGSKQALGGTKSNPSVLRAIVRESRSEPEVATAELVKPGVELVTNDISSPGDQSNHEQAAATASEQLSLNGSGLELLRDDEDFIEFLSSNNNKHKSCQFEASQFDASQFSASDFTSSTSTSESDNSGAGKDSLESPKLPKRNKSSELPLTGILKRSKEKERSNNLGKVGDVLNENQSKNQADLETILGNVIDVDVCSLKYPRSSPLSSQQPGSFN